MGRKPALMSDIKWGLETRARRIWIQNPATEERGGYHPVDVIHYWMISTGYLSDDSSFSGAAPQY